MARAGAFSLPIFPLPGALLLPRIQLPLHIFERRYRDMVRDALAGGERIGMIQPRGEKSPRRLYAIGCVGRIAGSERLEDGRYNIVLEGETRFRVVRELECRTAYRQVEADSADFAADLDEAEPLAGALRADLEREARRYADSLGYGVDWQAVSRLDDEMLVNGIAQIAPFDIGSKQALLECAGIAERAGLLVQLMRFQRLAPGGADAPETLQ